MQAPAKPRGVAGLICPRRNVDCGGDDGCHVCYDWMHMEGTDPVSGEKVNGYDCVAHWQVKIGLHTIRSVEGGLDGLQKATESARNEVVIASHRTCQTLVATAAPRAGSILLEDKSR